MIYAVIPAGGCSRRMGRNKLTLPLGQSTVLAHTIGTLRNSGISAIVVVVPPQAPELVPLIESAGGLVCHLPTETADMRETVEYALASLEARYRPEPEDAWYLVPADHPLVDAGIVRQLRDAYATRPDRSVIVPVYDGRRGHPTLIAWRHVSMLRQHPPGQGIDTFLKGLGDEVLEVPVPSASVLWNLNTPEDYEAVCQAIH